MHQSFSKGFTLIEVTLTMALLAIIFIVAAPFYGRFIFSQEVSIVQDELQGSLSKARFFSMMGKNDTVWGVGIENSQIIVFQGPSFVDRDTSLDETFDIHPRVTVSGVSPIVFTRPAGRPSSELEITLSGNGETKVLRMNSEGVLEE